MSVRIEINRNAVEARIKGAWKKGLPLLANEVRSDCNMYCKEYTGALIASSLIHSKLDEGKIIWQTPYAKRQYWEIQTAYKVPNPNASWKWAEVAKTHHIDRWQKQAQRITEMNL